MLNLNFQHTGPIYEKLRDELRRMLVTGALSEGEKLPSVRELAASLAINPNTIQRAYRELEAEGYVYSVPGKGSFVSSRKEVDGGRKKKLMAQLQNTLYELRYIGVQKEDIFSCLESVFS